MRRHAFTLVEMLIVISVIIILVGMLLAGLSIVSKAQAKAETAHLIDQICTAITMYEDKVGPMVSSNGSAPVIARRWDGSGCITNLVTNPTLRGDAPYLEIQSKYWGDSSGVPTITSSDWASILDSYGDRLLFEIWTLSSGSYTSASTRTGTNWSGLTEGLPSGSKKYPLVDGCVIRSMCGTSDPATPTAASPELRNDVIYVFTKAGGWKRQQ